ncbi:hypothetical protein G3A39_42830 [Paraburkholderia aspalathi]|nr:hypothetical protein [Paraburkholderia aspalathi]
MAPAVALFGPYGYLNGNRMLSEDSWEIESDPDNNDDEHFSIPLFSKVDPFKVAGIGQASVPAVDLEEVAKAFIDGFEEAVEAALNAIDRHDDTSKQEALNEIRGLKPGTRATLAASEVET